jgi:methylphosphotriester-DNA--protein-cysteine methyltransferase
MNILRKVSYYSGFGPFMRKQLSHQLMIEAVLSRDTKYDGQFFFGVTSTKIFCLPSCKAKRSLVKNLRFFRTSQEAISAGFRGCHRCFSANYPDFNPNWLEKVMNTLKNQLSERITESELSKIAGVDITTIRRYFKLKYNITPLSYHRKVRLQHAKYRIENGEKIKQIAKNSGFRSFSGFKLAFEKEFGFFPTD